MQDGKEAITYRTIRNFNRGHDPRVARAAAHLADGGLQVAPASETVQNPFTDKALFHTCRNPTDDRSTRRQRPADVPKPILGERERIIRHSAVAKPRNAQPLAQADATARQRFDHSAQPLRCSASTVNSQH